MYKPVISTQLHTGTDCEHTPRRTHTHQIYCTVVTFSIQTKDAVSGVVSLSLLKLI